jgi:regulator of sigma E protease
VPFDLLELVATKIYPAILVVVFFALTILVHELGHFVVARWRGMVVERFFIGFGPRIFSWKRKGVEYGVAWIPFGGYVALPQMSPMEVIEGRTPNATEELPAVRPGTKILVALAGPAMNVVFAFVLAAIVWWIGMAVPVNPAVVGWVELGSREEQLGIQVGDRITQVNDRPVKSWMDIQRAVAVSREPTVQITLVRDGRQFQHTLETQVHPDFGIKTINLFSMGRPVAQGFLRDSPAREAGLQVGDKFLSVQGVPVTNSKELRDLVGQRAGVPTEIRVMRKKQVVSLTVVPRLDPKDHQGRIGVELGDALEYEVVRPGPTPLQQVRDVLALMGDTAYALLHHKDTGIGARSLSGPVGIVGGWWLEMVHGGVRRGLWFAVLLNINLAILNLIPFPVLDGGHILLSVCEAIRRKPLNARFVHAVSVACAVVLISFIIYVTFFDLQRLAWRRVRARGGPAPAAEELVPVEPPQP